MTDPITVKEAQRWAATLIRGLTVFEALEALDLDAGQVIAEADNWSEQPGPDAYVAGMMAGSLIGRTRAAAIYQMADNIENGLGDE